jgi:DNA-directed RNA polymerase subunit RPC12/RpoP
MYKCIRCAKEVPVDAALRRIRCPFCGYKMLVKTRSGEPRTIKAV